MPNQIPFVDLPAVVMVSMAGYKGPTLWHTPDGTPIVPIVPFTVRWFNKAGKSCSRTQFPLNIAYAITIHKSQGMTLDKVVIDLDDHDFTRGLSFVAISRTRAITDIAFRSHIGVGRLDKTKLCGGTLSGAVDKMKEDMDRRGRLGFTDGRLAEDLRPHYFEE
jgi:UvrD-like helicase C-terminal domain